jgi:hypothetical protein
MLFEQAIDKPIVRISSEKDRFDITKDKTLHCFFNSNAVIGAKINDDSFWPITGLLVRATIRPGTEVIIKAEKNFSDFVTTLMDTINKSKQEKVKVLEEKPDEMTENSPAEEYHITAEEINSYREQLKNFSETFEDAIESSAILLRTSFPKTMWGAKELKSSLSKMKVASSEIESTKEVFEGAVEQSDLRISHLASCLFEKSNRKYAEDSIDHIITNFLTMKRMMASFLQSFHRLYTSDQLFKKYSGYPATWFFDPSVFYNFIERYEDVSDNLIEASRAESLVIRPLYAWFQSTHRDDATIKK